MSNINEFNTGVGHLFSMLYQNFPIPINFSSSDLAMESECEPEVAEAAVQWLLEEGFIRVADQNNTDGYYGAVLTLKGLQTLSLVPSGLSASIGDSLVDAVTSGTKDSIKELTKRALIDWGPIVLQKVLLAAMP